VGVGAANAVSAAGAVSDKKSSIDRAKRADVE
jgi:hypothetical protein